MTQRSIDEILDSCIHESDPGEFIEVVEALREVREVFGNCADNLEATVRNSPNPEVMKYTMEIAALQMRKLQRKWGDET